MAEITGSDNPDIINGTPENDQIKGLLGLFLPAFYLLNLPFLPYQYHPFPNLYL